MRTGKIARKISTNFTWYMIFVIVKEAQVANVKKFNHQFLVLFTFYKLYTEHTLNFKRKTNNEKINILYLSMIKLFKNIF